MNPFDELEQYYPETIKKMKPSFNAHQFILVLVHQHQQLYVQALAQYSDNEFPFMIVHAQLAKRLNNFKDLVEYVRDVPSTDIFGHSNSASKWIKK